MDISKEMAAAINGQIQAEFQSAYLYLSMAAWFEEQNLPGFASWMKKQYAEEVEHAMKMFEYLAERGGRVELLAIEAPRKDWACAKEVFAQTLDHERSVTKRIYQLVDVALTEKDHATTAFLHWYVKEQVEEESTASSIVAKLEMIGDSPVGLLALDRELGVR